MIYNMATFSLTQNGLTYTNENNETKSIVIDNATNTIKFVQFNISTPSVTNVEYTTPVDISGTYTDDPYWSGGVITQTGTSAVFTAASDTSHTQDGVPHQHVGEQKGRRRGGRSDVALSPGLRLP